MKRWGFIFFLLIFVGTAFLREHIRDSESVTPAGGEFNIIIDPTKTQEQLVTNLLLGPFRGLISAGLWWRINDAETKGNYTESLQIGSWLSKLQPQNGTVWSFQARNLAYNIPFNYPEAEVRWQWVRRGLALLLEDGLRSAPESESVRGEIATILIEKCCGGVQDFAIPTYRAAFSKELCTFLRDGDRAEIAAMQSVDLLPDSFRSDPRVELFLYGVKRTTGLDLLDPVVYEDSATVHALRTVGVFNDSRTLYPLGIIELYHRAKNFRAVWNVDFTRMLYIDSEYGPFDWRMPMGYVVYWRADMPFAEYIQQPPTHRPEIRIAMRLAFEGGRLMADPAAVPFIQLADWRIINKFRAYVDALPDHGDAKELTDRYRDDFLRYAAAVLYVNNRIDDARNTYRDYQKYYPDYKEPFETFILNSMSHMLLSDATASHYNLVVSSLFQAEVARMTGNPDLATGYEQLARLVWERNRADNIDAPNRQLPSLNLLSDAAHHQLEHVMADHRGEELHCDEDHGSTPQ